MNLKAYEVVALMKLELRHLVPNPDRLVAMIEELRAAQEREQAEEK